MTLWNHGEAPPGSFTCPACGAVSHHPMDLRFGWCGRCRNFTGDPTGFVIRSTMTPEEQEAWDNRVLDSVRALFENRPAPVLTEEELIEVRKRNLAEFERHERLALDMAHSPSTDHSVVLPRFKHRATVDPADRVAYWWSALRWTAWDQWPWRIEHARYRGRRIADGQ